MVGAEDETVTLKEFEVFPPSVTVMPYEPAVTKAELGMTAVNWVELTYVVESAVPLKFATELDVKFVPLIDSVVLGEPTVTVVTDREVMDGVPESLEPFPQPEARRKRATKRTTTTERRQYIGLPNRAVRLLVMTMKQSATYEIVESAAAGSRTPVTCRASTNTHTTRVPQKQSCSPLTI